MTLYFEDEGDVRLPIDAQVLAEKVIGGVLDYENCPYQVEVNLLLTNNEAIQRMNAEFRKIDKSTDVLSFPMINFGQAGQFDFLEVDEQSTDEEWRENLEEGYFHPESGELILGDIAISKDRVLEQAELYGHSVQREFAFLIAHSVLHLIGYDHMEESARLIMESKQREILERLNILR